MRPTALVLGSAAAAVLAALLTPAQALDRTVTLHNDTAYDIVEFYGSNVASGAWGESRLNGRVLAAGSTAEIVFEDHNGYCLFNFRAVFEDGDEIVSERVNVCEGEYYYRP